MICRRAVDYSSVIVLVRTRIIETAEFVESSSSVERIRFISHRKWFYFSRPTCKISAHSFLRLCLSPPLLVFLLGSPQHRASGSQRFDRHGHRSVGQAAGASAHHCCRELYPAAARSRLGQTREDTTFLSFPWAFTPSRFDHPGFQDADVRRCGAGHRQDAHPGCDAAGRGRRGARRSLGQLRR